MANTFDYTAVPVTVEIKNVIDKASYRACDAGTPVQKVEAKYDDIKDKPCVKFDYIFNADGSFKTDSDGDYVVLVYEKFKTTQRVVPAYRTMFGKVLEAGDSVKFVTSNKDEVIFYEKFAEAFKGEIEITITPSDGE